MRRVAALTLAAALAAGCADTGAPARTEAGPTALPQSSTTTSTPAEDPLVAWCRTVDPDFCILGLGALAEDAGRRDCVFSSRDMPGLLDCVTASSGAVTTTTQLGSDEEPTEEQILAWRLAAEAEIERVLPLAHPGYLAAAGLVLAEPMTLPDAVAVADRLGLRASGAWLAAPVCVDGYAALGMGESPVSVRFAYLDGEAEVDRREAALTAGGAVITGRHLFDTAAAALIQASEAAQQPGVLVEAVSVLVVPGSAARLAADDQVRAVRILPRSPHGALAPGDLSAQPPAC